MQIKNILSLVLISLLFLVAKGQKNARSVFDIEKIHEVRITFSQTNYMDSLAARYTASHAEESPAADLPLMASAEIDGVKIDSIGVSMKSYLSYSIPSDKKPIKLSFNHFVKRKDFQGLHRLNLSNEFPDPSMLRNTIAFYILRKSGIMAPRTSFARVYINKKFAGLYVLVEQIDKQFLEKYFRPANGDLVKALGSSLYWAADEDMETFRKNFEVKSKDVEGAYSRLISFATKLNSMSDTIIYEKLKSDFDFKSYVKILAADVIFNNWDSYFYGQNYYLYRNDSLGKYFFLPWDYNLAMNNYEVSGGDYNILPGGNGSFVFNLPLPSKVVGNKFLRNQYLVELDSINRLMNIDSLEGFIHRLHDMIRKDLTDDAGRGFAMTQYETSLDSKVETSEMEIEGLLTFIRYRHKQVEEMLIDERSKH